MVRKRGKKKLTNKSTTIQSGTVQKASVTKNDVSTTATTLLSKMRSKRKIKSKKNQFKLKPDSDSAVYYGTVRWYNYLKIFGVIKRADKGPDIFVHGLNVVPVKFTKKQIFNKLINGHTVSFKHSTDLEGKLNAVEVTVLDTKNNRKITAIKNHEYKLELAAKKNAKKLNPLTTELPISDISDSDCDSEASFTSVDSDIHFADEKSKKYKNLRVFEDDNLDVEQLAEQQLKLLACQENTVLKTADPVCFFASLDRSMIASKIKAQFSLENTNKCAEKSLDMVVCYKKDETIAFKKSIFWHFTFAIKMSIQSC